MSVKGAIYGRTLLNYRVKLDWREGIVWTHEACLVSSMKVGYIHFYYQDIISKNKHKNKGQNLHFSTCVLPLLKCKYIPVEIGVLWPISAVLLSFYHVRNYVFQSGGHYRYTVQTTLDGKISLWARCWRHFCMCSLSYCIWIHGEHWMWIIVTHYCGT